MKSPISEFYSVGEEQKFAVCSACTSTDNVSTVSTTSPNAITWNIDSQGSVGICCQYKRPSPSTFSCGMAETSGSSLPGQTVPTHAANIGPARLEWRFGAVSSICKARSRIANWEHSTAAPETVFYSYSNLHNF